MKGGGGEGGNAEVPPAISHAFVWRLHGPSFGFETRMTVYRLWVEAAAAFHILFVSPSVFNVFIRDTLGLVPISRLTELHIHVYGRCRAYGYVIPGLRS